MRKLLSQQEGFTLITAAVCTIIVSITALGMYGAIIMGNRYIADSRRVTKAMNIARAMLEELADDPTAVILYPAGAEELPNITWQVEYLDSLGAVVPDTNVTNVDPLIIRLTVFWHQGQGSPERSVQLSTKITHGLT